MHRLQPVLSLLVSSLLLLPLFTQVGCPSPEDPPSIADTADAGLDSSQDVALPDAPGPDADADAAADQTTTPDATGDADAQLADSPDVDSSTPDAAQVDVPQDIPPVETTGTGASCSDPIVISQTPLYVLSGEDFVFDFHDGMPPTSDDSCVGSSSNNWAEEVVLQLDVLAGQRLGVSVTGGATLAAHILATCNAAAPCLGSTDQKYPGGLHLTYEAVSDETLTVIVEVVKFEWNGNDYEIRLGRSTCGDGIVEEPEDCEDAQAGEGCTDCQADFGYECGVATAPSGCSPMTDLGTFAAGQTIPLVQGSLVSEGGDEWYQIAFTGDVTLGATLSNTGLLGADLDLFAYNEAGEVVLESIYGGDEYVNDLFLAAGPYMLRVNAFEVNDLGPAEFELQLSTAAIVCGDGNVQGTELCDDGDSAGGDGCDADCQLEAGWACPGWGGACHEILCGDGITDAPEVCDDANAMGGDGCAADCKSVEDGYLCPDGPWCYAKDGGSCAQPIPLVAADGVADPGAPLGGMLESSGWDDSFSGWSGDCDLGAEAPAAGSGDAVVSFDLPPNAEVGVTALAGQSRAVFLVTDCANAAGSCVAASASYASTINTTAQPITYFAILDGANTGSGDGEVWLEVMITQHVCGDGKVGGLETCDDGPVGDGDGCSAGCQIEAGWKCPDWGGACQEIVCGDGLTDAPETCDDKNDQDGDGCSGCAVDAGWVCSGWQSGCHELVCGDAWVEGEEVCDDGNDVAGDGCSADCSAIEDGFSCNVAGVFCYPNDGGSCAAPITLSSSENMPTEVGGEILASGWTDTFSGWTGACDLGVGAPGTGTPDAVVAVDVPPGAQLEVSSFGEVGGALYVSTDCANAAATCVASDPYMVTVPTNTQAQTVTYFVIVELEATEPTSSVFLDVYLSGEYCGNQMIDSGESCDDGAADSGDGCSAGCQVEPGWVCAEWGGPCHHLECGDGIVDAPETCDDSNPDGGDGCSADCLVEAGWTCPDGPGACHEIVCGDGLIDAPEACDDKNTAGQDGCAADCSMVEDGWYCGGAPSQCGTAGACGTVIPIIKEGDGLIAFELDVTTLSNDFSGWTGLCVDPAFPGDGVDAVLTLEVPPYHFGLVQVGSDELRLYLVEDCTAAVATCPAAAPPGNGQVEVLNETGMMATYLIVVEVFTGAAGPLELTAEIMPL